MATSKQAAPAVISNPVAEEAPAGEDLTVDEFCIRLSVSDRRVEIITAFASVMRAAGVVKDSEAGFNARLTDFINQPA